MHDDHVQGILFSSSQFVDLSPRPKRQVSQRRFQSPRRYDQTTRQQAESLLQRLTPWRNRQQIDINEPR